MGKGNQRLKMFSLCSSHEFTMRKNKEKVLTLLANLFEELLTAETTTTEMGIND